MERKLKPWEAYPGGIHGYWSIKQKERTGFKWWEIVLTLLELIATIIAIILIVNFYKNRPIKPSGLKPPEDISPCPPNMVISDVDYRTIYPSSIKVSRVKKGSARINKTFQPSDDIEEGNIVSHQLFIISWEGRTRLGISGNSKGYYLTYNVDQNSLYVNIPIKDKSGKHLNTPNLDVVITVPPLSEVPKVHLKDYGVIELPAFNPELFNKKLYSVEINPEMTSDIRIC